MEFMLSILHARKYANNYHVQLYAICFSFHFRFCFSSFLPFQTHMDKIIVNQRIKVPILVLTSQIIHLKYLVVTKMFKKKTHLVLESNDIRDFRKGIYV